MYECYSDPAYYDMWAVKKKESSDFNGTIHVATKEEAKHLVDILNERARPELLKAVDRMIHLHLCEQEGIEMPKPSEWIEAVDNLCKARKYCACEHAVDSTVEDEDVETIAREMEVYAEACQRKDLKGVATRVRDWVERLERFASRA